MIKVEKIKKTFKEVNVLHDISFEIKKGDYIAVMGPSGSGKSTLLYSVSGMDNICSGNVFFEETDIHGLSEKKLASFRLNKMGFVFQNVQMLKNLSVFDNIILPGLVANTTPVSDVRKRAQKLMERMDIMGLENRDLNEVSGGQLQRASICRAMINEPKILFMDEPTGALNSQATGQVLDILEDLNNEGMSIMIVTHDEKVAARAKKVLYIRDGLILDEKVLHGCSHRETELQKWLANF